MTQARRAGARILPALTGQGVYPRPIQDRLPVWVGVGGTPASFARTGALGGNSRITFQMITPALETERMQRSITLLGEEVAPMVRAAL